MSAVRWKAQSSAGSACLLADDGRLVLHASHLGENARVPLTDADLRELRTAIDLHLRDRDVDDEDDDLDVW